MHRWRTGERILANAEARHQVDFPVQRLANGYAAESAREIAVFDAGDADAIELTIEVVGILRLARRNEGTSQPSSDAVSLSCLACFQPQFGEHSTDLSCPGIIALLDE